MARIRSIKPAFFRHEELFEAEKETGLPLRLAFAGLWTAADREGRFKWSARNLKLDCLPYDDVDFSRVLDALTTRGFIVKYAVNGVEFGFIPSWKSHQVINNREAASELPEPNENNILTRGARVDDARVTPLVQVQGEGKGRERKGKDADAPASRSDPSPEIDYFRRIKEICGASGGGLGKKLLDAKGGSIPLARAAVEQASTKEDPREYLGAIIRGRGGGVDDLRARGEAW
jgi:hypothetical protein